MHRFRTALLLLILTAMVAMGGVCNAVLPSIAIPFPFPQQLSLVGDVLVRVKIPIATNPAELAVELDGNPIALGATANPRVFEALVNVASVGSHTLVAVDTGLNAFGLVRNFETITLQDPDECDVLNSASCMLPWPSSRFLAPDGGTDTGLRLQLPQVGLPTVNGPPLDADIYNVAHVIDGYSPTAQILMHFPGGVDLAASGAPVLIAPGAPVGKPFFGIRTGDDTSLQATTPTVLIHADTGQKIVHFVELDDRATGGEIPSRQALVMRPGEALEPGERYIVAVRGLVDGGAQPVEPEAPFAALRDERFSDIDAVAQRRPYYEANIFPQLAAAGIARNDLILAFDFTVQSDNSLTFHVRSMRAQAMTWLAGQVQPTFTVDSVDVNDCNLAGVDTWKIVRGTFEVPLYLTQDPEITFSFGVLNLDGSGVPLQTGITNPPYTISIPCSVNDVVPPVAHPVVLGHGLFGLGDGMVTGLSAIFSPQGYITGATDWRGLSNPDFLWVGTQIVGTSMSKLNNFPAFADRLKQGQINTQVLARMMKDGLFNADVNFEDDLSQGVFPGATEDQYYLGISLGGVMGTFFAALTDDVERFNLDVPAINFSMLLQRSTQFSSFDALLAAIGLTDPMDAILGLGIIHELWVRGEPAGYVHILDDEVAVGDKRLLMTVAWLDKQVSNQASEVMARSLGLPNLTASVLQGMEGIPDVADPQDSAMVIYDTGSFDIFDPLHQPDIPPLANQIPTSTCDPHGARPAIPASVSQVTNFLQPGGQVVNFCVGICDGIQAEGETANGNPACDPLAP